MAQNNIYDTIIAELVYRSNFLASLHFASITIVSNQAGNTQVPFNFNGNVVFTATVNNIPSGYTIKTNSFVIDLPATPDVVGSSNPLSTPATAVAFTTIGQTFVVNATVTLEHTINPNIILNTTFTLTAASALFAGSKVGNGTFNTTGLTAYLYNAGPIEVYMGGTGAVYPYIVLPVGGPGPLYFKDENSNILPISSFTITTSGGFIYYVLTWSTIFFPITGLKWSIIFF